MIGNDLVDLQLARSETDWRRSGFLSKVFDDREKHYISTSKDPETVVWRLWSMKESAYKAYLRVSPERFFNPKKLKCTLFNDRDGMVAVGSQQYRTLTNITLTSIHTVALADGVRSFDSSCFALSAIDYSTQHQETRQKLKERLASLASRSPEHLHIRKDSQGKPSAYVGNEFLTKDLSITHHGNFGAFAFIY